MELQFEISKRLAREHQDVLGLLGRLETFLLPGPKGPLPDWQAPETRRLLSDLKGALGSGVPNHFAIEERVLFPRFAEEHGPDLVNLLLEDHQVILALVADLLKLLEQALDPVRGLGQGDQNAFRAKGLALVSELSSHAEKEDLGFVPMMDELLDPATAKDSLDRYLMM